MKPDHTFDIVIVFGGHGAGGEITVHPDKTVRYSGAATEEKF